MALSSFPLNLPTAFSSSNCLSLDSCSFFIGRNRNDPRNTFRTLRTKPCCCYDAVQFETQECQPPKVVYGAPRKKRKPRPSFFEQIQDKWSYKIESPREKFPWQIEEQRERQEEGQVKVTESLGDVFMSKSETDRSLSLKEAPKVTLGNHFVSAPWIHGGTPRKSSFRSETRTPKKRHERGENSNWVSQDSENNDGNPVIQRLRSVEREAKNFSRAKAETKVDPTPIGDFEGISLNDTSSPLEDSCEDNHGLIGLLEQNLTSLVGDVKGVSLDNMSIFDEGSQDDTAGLSGFLLKEEVLDLDGEERLKSKSNTRVAESTIPEHELQRLRRISLRMLERFKVGVSGITQALVDSIHEKWKVDEVVKLKFEGPLGTNMKRVHEILESKTGGLVIWRSGSSVVLYRGMTYNLQCVQQFAKQSQPCSGASQSSKDLGTDTSLKMDMEDSVRTSESSVPDFLRQRKELSKEDLVNISEFNQLLDGLGPRFEDWPGRDPLPIDADLLPSVVPGYQPPFRLLPYGTKLALQNRQMTYFRRLARRMPPHFALGRNKQLQGLAVAMVKLWEGSAIVKIAIKRGVQNTLNDRMAEELKVLTGGTLLSRNKDFIVFYRGNDFLPPRVVEKLKSRQKTRDLQQDEEEQVRNKASTIVDSNAKPSKSFLVAGTLAETMAASSRWGTKLSSKDREEMMRDLALARRASLVRYLEKKLALAKGKVKQAEKTLAKVQIDLEPAALPTDLETISDEERFLFRKIGLSMKPYLVLGRREVFDGVVENMHLHWKYREVVKVLVKRRSPAQIKHIAISLEAESGGVLVSLDKTTKGVAIIFYRGKNYQRPRAIRPKNLLTKRQALARSIELQRREQLRHHVWALQEKIELLKSELDKTTAVKEIDEETFYSRMNDAYPSDDDTDDDEEEEEYIEMCDSGNGESNAT